MRREPVPVAPQTFRSSTAGPLIATSDEAGAEARAHSRIRVKPGRPVDLFFFVERILDEKNTKITSSDSKCANIHTQGAGNKKNLDIFVEPKQVKFSFLVSTGEGCGDF